MHIPTHVMSGWCVGASLPLTARERLACMINAGGADLDGISLAWGWAMYRRWHHVLGHNVFFGLLAVLCARFLAAPGRRVMMTVLGLALFHVHLVLDYHGSGSGWPIYYFWPFSRWGWVNPEAWEFGGWQSYATMAGLLLWTLAIALFKRCTRFELVAPGLENDWRLLLSRLGSSSKPRAASEEE